MADNARAKRLADLIREVVAQKLQRGIKDPRLGTHVTITDTRVTGDLREATVFYTVYGDDEERQAAAAGLESAKGVLRSEVGRAAGVKFTPTLTFIMDALPDTAKNIEDLLDRARQSDAAVREAAAGAGYAGEADPYRKPGDDDETADTDDDTDDGADETDDTAK
ncbi:30S ribosome-binding factor RbfA [Streptomyces ziwulingensis]|uniref:Ribosome-binding factor A n=1 Tax=Streptomyces ziwulingensis TaxID=1045501 RepID=A0ABP9CBW4_9ACTN